MDVFYDNNFNSMVKAAILREVRGYNPVNYYTSNCKTTDDFTMNELLIEWDWVKGTPRNINELKNAVMLALKHKRATNELIFKVITQALTWGVDYVLTRNTPESKRFCNMIVAVRNELRKAKMNIRFIKYGNTIIGKYYFAHKISSLLQEFYQKRFPNKKVIITNESIGYSNTRQPVIKQLSKPLMTSTPAVTLKAFL